MESTAGAYLGKYLSATFGSLHDATESFDEPDESPFRCILDYLGAYAYWDLPSIERSTTQNLESAENLVSQDVESSFIDSENDPPIATVWD